MFWKFNFYLFFIKEKWIYTMTRHPAESNNNPFVPNAPFPYVLKTSQNTKVSGIEKGCIGNEWVNISLTRNLPFDSEVRQ